MIGSICQNEKEISQIIFLAYLSYFLFKPPWHPNYLKNLGGGRVMSTGLFFVVLEDFESLQFLNPSSLSNPLLKNESIDYLSVIFKYLGF